jgi:hypothetical protein
LLALLLALFEALFEAPSYVASEGFCLTFMSRPQRENRDAVEYPGSSARSLSFRLESWMAVIKMLESHTLLIRAINGGISGLDSCGWFSSKVCGGETMLHREANMALSAPGGPVSRTL